MPNYKVYVRGHGGEKPHILPPSKDLPIEMITVGQFGCTMSDEVADEYIFQHVNVEDIEHQIEENVVIYWTEEQREDWYEYGRLKYSKPNLDFTPYETLNQNLALDGASDIEGECGVCYWNEPAGRLEWIITLGDCETVLLSEILEELEKKLSEGDTIQLFWTACMSAGNWTGSQKKVSFNPKKKTAAG